jgi:GNAT superfamily N-acetyltransferase
MTNNALPVVHVGDPRDFDSWIELVADEEEPSEGLGENELFRDIVRGNLERGTAFCVRAENGPPGSRVLAGLILLRRPPVYEIGWMGVLRSHRRRGLGTALVRHVRDLVPRPAEWVVTTFGPASPFGEPARRFYAKMGFLPAELVDAGSDGFAQQVFRRPP